ncbi:hypothetical protein CEXT_59591 [Caerostris extrusa]|uniref:Uncharacterized protein n=1 Tax=Caerostris extrusa TaxID=172846 RepID=A0AAV4QVW9_CAEEX|nr:hypothetical protein CEXT_59591 [Caerostris extrusa]
MFSVSGSVVAADLRRRDITISSSDKRDRFQVIDFHLLTLQRKPSTQSAQVQWPTNMCWEYLLRLGFNS